MDGNGVRILDVDTACFSNRGLASYSIVFASSGCYFVLYHFFGLGVLIVSPSFFILTAVINHIGMNGKSFRRQRVTVFVHLTKERPRLQHLGGHGLHYR